MEDGEVVGFNKPSKLLESCDLYKKLWKLDNYAEGKDRLCQPRKIFKPATISSKKEKLEDMPIFEEGSVEIVKLTPKGLSVLVTLQKGHYSERWQSLKGVEKCWGKGRLQPLGRNR